MANIGELTHVTAWGLELPQVGDIYYSDDGTKYKIVKIKSMRWGRKWLFIKTLTIKTVVKVVE